MQSARRKALSFLWVRWVRGKDHPNFSLRSPLRSSRLGVSILFLGQSRPPVPKLKAQSRNEEEAAASLSPINQSQITIPSSFEDFHFVAVGVGDEGHFAAA
jgi:hypothetical protein